MDRLSRRDFLKLTTAVAGGMAASGLASRANQQANAQGRSKPSVLILVLDAMSASNLSLYGYARPTTPNLQRLAARATVYHQHYAAGNFTTPGTASLLTGLYPWTHRAINQAGLIARPLAERNIFGAVGRSYHRLAFSQNPWPNYFFGQFRSDLERVVKPTAFGLMRLVTGEHFDNDLTGAYRALDDFLLEDGVPPAALLMGLAERLHGLATKPPDEEHLAGITMRRVFDGVGALIESMASPGLAYLHLFPPHAPYRPSREFEGAFADGWTPPRKRSHKLVDARTHRSAETLNEMRQTYDEYIAHVDAELGRLFDDLSARGVLDNTYVLLTSDHGEMFERGEQGHLTPLLYDPVVRVPLVIWAPGQTARQDVRVPTSAVDLLPTVVHLTGGEVPQWCEGQVLPPLGGADDPERSVFVVEAQTDAAFKPLRRASLAIRKGRYKLIDYMGYPQFRVQHRYEMYDMQGDPQELNNIYSGTLAAAWTMREELLGRLAAADSIYAA